MSATAYQRNRMLATLAGCYLSLHTADGGETGAHELTGAGYARQPAPLGAAVDGRLATIAEVSFPDLPAAAVTHYGAWSDARGGSFLWPVALATPRTVARGDGLTFSPDVIAFIAA